MFSAGLKNTFRTRLPHCIRRQYLATKIDAVASEPLESDSLSSFREHKNEDIKQLKSRLLYQSRKRGMLENGLILSTFAAKFLSSMTDDQLRCYDKLINKPSNDWDLYYWTTGVKETPEEYQHEVMQMLKDHVKNEDRQSRIQQPDLY